MRSGLDERGRKIVEIGTANKELFIKYIISFILVYIVGCFVNSFIDVEFESMEEVKNASFLYGIIYMCIFMVTWVVTFKCFINNLAIRKVSMKSFKSTVTLINVLACVLAFFAFSVEKNVGMKEIKKIYDEALAEYDRSYTSQQILESNMAYNKYVNGQTIKFSQTKEEILAEKAKRKAELDVMYEEADDMLSKQVLILGSFSAFGVFLGCAFVKDDIEAMGIEEKEYKKAMGMKYKDDEDEEDDDEFPNVVIDTTRTVLSKPIVENKNNNNEPDDEEFVGFTTLKNK